MDVGIGVDLAGSDRGLLYNGLIGGALQNDIAHLVVGIFDYGATTAPSLGYYYWGDIGSVTIYQLTAASAGLNGRAAFINAGNAPVATKIGTVNCSGCDFSSFKEDWRRYLFRDYLAGSGWVDGATSAKFTNIPVADAGGLHRYVVFAAAYDDNRTGSNWLSPSLLGYAEAKAFSGTIELPGSTSSDVALAALTIHLNAGLLQTGKALTQGPAVTPLVPGAANSAATAQAAAVQTLITQGDPVGVAVDPSGNIWNNAGNGNVAKRDSSGNLIELFGTGSAGWVDSAGGAPKFSSVRGFAFDSAGNTYVADCGNHAIRKIAADCTVTTYAGGGPAAPGLVDAIGGGARFNCPSGVAVDGTGNVWVADNGNHAIRKIDAIRSVTTLAGDGTAGANEGAGARFNWPTGLVVTSSGASLYVVDKGNHKIRKVSTATGNSELVAGTSGQAGHLDAASGASALFNEPWGIAGDSSGYLYVTDSAGGCAVRKIAPGASRTVTTIAGTVGCGDVDGAPIGAAKFSSPRGIALTGSLELLVADYVNWKIKKFNLTHL
ncbi:MAG: hypothetical protein FJZ01_12240 [Candidatus Sericytochromatia bacterium]|nr:hypothetical protein [Candidatus Tanganyikabacteria bacterium]